MRIYDNWRLHALNPINGINFVPLDSNDGTTYEGYNISNQGTPHAGSTASELAHLFYNTLDNPAYYTVGGATTGCSAPAYCLARSATSSPGSTGRARKARRTRRARGISS